MSNIEITFETPWMLLLLIPVLAVIILPFLLLTKGRRKSVKKIIPVVLHSVIAVLLVLIMAGMNIVKTSDEQAVVILADMSFSTNSVKDGMIRDAEELIKLIEENTPVGVIVFAEDQLYSVKPGLGVDKIIKTEPLGVEATDISAALKYAASVQGTDKALRIILMTDGKQTDGDGEKTARELAAKGIRIDGVYYDSSITTNEVQISSFTSPVSVYKNKEARFTTEIKSNVKADVRLKLFEDGNQVLEKTMTLGEGSNTAELTVTPSSTGVHTFRLVVESEQDTVKENNEYASCLIVEGKPSVLVVADSVVSGDILKSIIKDNCEVTCVPSYNAPESLVEMCKYDGIILSNANRFYLPLYFDEYIDDYVSKYGRSLMIAGGKDTLMYGNMNGSIYQNLLPVEMTIEESTEGVSVAVMLVIDVSNSMRGEYVALAKQGAIKSLDAMTDNDYVGVVSFHKTANLDVPLLVADKSNKELLTRAISALKTGNGTYYAEALELATAELSKSDADVKHILFLSDGYPSDSGFYEIIANATTEGITVSTIGLDFSSDTLDYMASVGKGRYYYVESVEELPDIMLSETEQARVSTMIIDDISVSAASGNEFSNILAGQTLPNIKGYLGTTLKDKAEEYMTTEKGHPLFASWGFGFGKVSVFTSDLKAEWTKDWFENDTAADIINSMVLFTMNDSPIRSSIIVETKTYTKSIKLSIKTSLMDEESTVSVRVNGSEDEYKAHRLWAGMYEVSIPTEPNGKYEFEIIEESARGRLMDTYKMTLAAPYSGEYDSFSPGGEALLQNICSYHEGGVYTDLSELAGIKMNGIKIVFDPVTLFGVIALCLLLVDIGVRKLRWKDIKNTLVKLGILKNAE